MVYAQVLLWHVTSVITDRLRNGPRAQTGQGLIEYALIIALVAVGAVLILGTLGTKVQDTFTHISSCLPGGTCTP